MEVHKSGFDRAQVTLSNGVAATVYGNSSSGSTCTTDKPGQCTFPTLIGATLGFSATHQLVEGDPSTTVTASAGALIAADPTDVILAFTSPSPTVTLSGVVSEASGAPSPDTNVSFGGVSTVTDASGAYVLHPFAGTTAFLNSRRRAHTEYGPDDGVFTIAADAVVNFVWPAPAQVQTTLVDATSTPLPGVEVHRSGFDRAQTTLSNGVVATVYGNTSGSTCTTDGAGQCTFPTLIGATPSFSATQQLVPGDSSYPTLTASASALITAETSDVTWRSATWRRSHLPGRCRGQSWRSSRTVRPYRMSRTSLSPAIPCPPVRWC